MSVVGYAGTDEETEDRGLKMFVLRTFAMAITARQNAAQTV